MLTWRGVVYHGGLAVRGLELGTRVGTGIVPPCTGPGDPIGSPTSLRLVRIDGVRPAIAVVAPRERSVYLADGFVVESPRHPLHTKIFPRGVRNETAGWACGRLFRRVANVANTPPNVLRVGRASYSVDARTVFSGRLTRFGVPYLRRGMRVVVVARACRRRGHNGQKLVARLLWEQTGAALANRRPVASESD